MNLPFSAGLVERTAEQDAIYRQIRAELHFELNLVNARVNWLIASQAFLFVPLTLSSQGGAMTESQLHPLIPLLGIATSLLVLVSIAAAVWRGAQWRAKARAGGYGGEGEAGRFSIVTPRTPLIPLMGAVGALGVPVVLTLTWAYLLVAPPG